ncbi:MAG: sulfite exporter TauE/SafE family protein, partial [Hoeflea sp.]
MPPFEELIWFAAALAGAGLVAGVLAGLFGIGGGAILVPVFYQVFGLLGVDEAVRMHLAVGTSLAIIVPTSLRSFLSHKARGAVDMKLLKSWIVPIPLGVAAASLIAASVSSGGLRAIFAIIAVLVGLRMLFNRVSWRLGDDL